MEYEVMWSAFGSYTVKAETRDRAIQDVSDDLYWTLSDFGINGTDINSEDF